MYQDTPFLYATLRSYRQAIGAPWFTKPWDLNLLIFRDQEVGTFGDRVMIATRDDAGLPVVFVAEAAGDAWRGEWLRPTHPQGCVFTLNGHYPGGFRVGLHKRRPALVQARPFRYVRWPGGSVPTVAQLEARALHHAFTDNRATNLHNRAGLASPAIPGTDDTEGCTLIRHQHEHAAIMQLAKQQEKIRGSDVVSPTFGSLADLADLKLLTRR